MGQHTLKPCMEGACRFDHSLARRVSCLRSRLSVSSHIHGRDQQPVEIGYANSERSEREGKRNNRKYTLDAVYYRFPPPIATLALSLRL